MPWFKVDENLLTHPKFMGASDGAVALWLRAGVWSASALTNGEVPSHALRMLAERGDHAAEELVERGLWERGKRGFRFHDWNDYQPTPEHVAIVREKRRAAGRVGGLSRPDKQNAKQVAKHNSSKTQANAKPVPVTDTAPNSSSSVTPVDLYSRSSAENADNAVVEIRQDIERICTHLADRIEGNDSKRPTIGKTWRTAARLLIDHDKKTEQQIHTAIDWCQDHEFWRGVVMSLPKLREKYDQMRLQAQRGSPAVPQETDEMLQRAMQRAIAREGT